MANKFHFSAGLELKSVRDSLVKYCEGTNQLIEYEGLKKALSSFVVKTDSDLAAIPENKDNRFAFVLHNLLVRGVPTLAAFELEEEFRSATESIIFKESSTKSLEQKLIEEKVPSASLLNALHFIEPRIDQRTAFENYLVSWENHGSEFEERYLYKELPARTFGGKGDFLIQLFQPQRSIGTIVPDRQYSLVKGTGFREQHVDFAVEYPYPVTLNKRKGFCVEIDGSQHEEQQQKYLDRKRDDVVLESDWLNTFRVKTSQFNEAGLTKHFQELNEREFSRTFFKRVYQNYSSPLYETDPGMRAMELVLSPYAIARIQYVLVKAVISGYLSFEEKIWRIAILERDVPCARLALSDLKRFLEAFSKLENKGRNFPEIELDVYFSPEFKSSVFRNEEDIPIHLIGRNEKQYDIFIDISVLERDGLSKRNEAVRYDAYFQIRSAFHFPVQPQPFLTTERIVWGELLTQEGEDKWIDHPITTKALEFFIQNIFRKKSFREGQLKILNRALKNQTVIGLLPTGGGKSLTYQLAGILQPGHVIVIDPIKSLMKDQVDSLAKIGITGTVFINSSLKDYEARNRAQSSLANGQALFCFISPERLMIQKFRESLASMANERHYFSYGVIDEVHCVSEWGHNFRTPYLSLGKNLLEFCKAADGEIALFGLTATASYDVLSDVQRELSGNKEDQMIPDEAIISHENTNRDELQYHVETVNLTDKEIADLQKNAKGPYFGLKLKGALGLQKQRRINQILTNPGQIIRKFNMNIPDVINRELILLTYNNDQSPSPEEVHQKIEIPNDSYEGDFWAYKDDEGNNNAALIFAPHKTWYFGVTDKYNKNDRRVGITESILRSTILPEDKIGTFMGVDSDDEVTAKKLQEDNDRNQEAFVEGKQQLMVATKAFGMGIDKPNIRLTIHNNFPDSIESFVQEAGRGGRDRRLSVACILFNNQEIKDPLKGKVYRHDLDLQESFFWNSFKGEDHEKRVLYELLTDIIFPGRDRISQLNKILNEHPDILDSGLRIWINHYEPKNRLYINGTNKQDYGYIEYLTGQFVSKWANVDDQVSIKYLSALWSIIRDLAIDIDTQYLQTWLNESGGTEKRPGIEKILKTLDFNGEFEVMIPFTNDHGEIYRNLAKLVMEFLDIPSSELTMKNFIEICKKNYNVKADKFFEGMDKQTRIIQRMEASALENNTAVENFKKKIQIQLSKRRDKQDTEKAIFRLSVIGLVDDYTVDYNSETYILFGKKKYPEEYHASLRFYISKYYSQKRTENIINSLPERKGNSEIQRILNFITDFVYNEVAKKRYESIDFMKECCLVGLNRGNVEMKSWIHLYFNSKYARKGFTVVIEDQNLHYFNHLPLMTIAAGEYNASLLDWTNEGQEEEFDYVLDFMHLMEFDNINSERDNLKHLRGACTRLAMANPDNYVFRLLRAFAVLVLEEANLKMGTKNSILDDLKKGYFTIFEREGEAFDLDDAMMQYKAVVRDKLQNQSAKDWFSEVMEGLEFLAHAEWTRQFKRKYTKDII